MASSIIQEPESWSYTNRPIGFHPDETGSNKKGKRSTSIEFLLLIVSSFLYLLVGRPLGYVDMSWLLITLPLWFVPALCVLFACLASTALATAFVVTLFITK